jgi:hypothetical protein
MACFSDASDIRSIPRITDLALIEKAAAHNTPVQYLALLFESVSSAIFS